MKHCLLGLFTDPQVLMLIIIWNLIEEIYQCFSFTQLLLMGDFNRQGFLQQFQVVIILLMCLESCEDVYLVQHVQNRTRSRGSQQPSLLDLIFTSTPDITHVAPLGSSDHNLLLCMHGAIYVYITNFNNLFMEYSRGNYTEFNNYFLQLDWSQTFNCIKTACKYSSGTTYLFHRSLTQTKYLSGLNKWKQQ